MFLVIFQNEYSETLISNNFLGTSVLVIHTADLVNMFSDYSHIIKAFLLYILLKLSSYSLFRILILNSFP